MRHLLCMSIAVVALASIACPAKAATETRSREYARQVVSIARALVNQPPFILAELVLLQELEALPR